MCPRNTAETLGADVDEAVAQVALYTAIYVPSYYCMCLRTVFVVLYMCPHITAESSEADVEEAIAHMCPDTTICVLILLHICPHTTVYYCSGVSSGCAGGRCASETLHNIQIHMCPHTTKYAS